MAKAWPKEAARELVDRWVLDHGLPITDLDGDVDPMMIEDLATRIELLLRRVERNLSRP